MNYQDTIQGNEVFAIISLSLSFLFVCFLVWAIWLCFKVSDPQQSPILEVFSEKFNMVLNQISECQTIERLEEIELYAQAIFSDEEIRNPANREDLNLIAEHLKLTRLLITGDNKNALNLIEKMEERILAKEAWYDSLRSYN
jgi:hypothetical protein